MRPYPYQRVHGGGPGRREQGIPRAVAVVLLVSALALYLFTSHVLVNRASASISISKSTTGQQMAMSVASLRNKHAEMALQRLREMEETDLASKAAQGDMTVVQPALDRVAWGRQGTIAAPGQGHRSSRPSSLQGPEGGFGMQEEGGTKKEDPGGLAAAARAARDGSLAPAFPRGENPQAETSEEVVEEPMNEAEEHEARKGDKDNPLPLLPEEKSHEHKHNDDAEGAEHEVVGEEGDGDDPLPLLPEEDKVEEQRSEQEGEEHGGGEEEGDGGDPLPMLPEDDPEGHGEEGEEHEQALGEQHLQEKQEAVEEDHGREDAEKGSAQDRGSSGGHRERRAGEEGPVLLPEEEEHGVAVDEGKAASSRSASGTTGAESGPLPGRSASSSGPGHPSSAGSKKAAGEKQRSHAKRKGAASESGASDSALSGAEPDAAWEPQHLNTQLLAAEAAASGHKLRAVTPQTLMELARATDTRRPLELGATVPRIACREGSDCPPGKLCVDDRCKCPVMYSGDANCTSHTLVEMPWCLRPSSAPMAVAAFKSKKLVDIGLVEGKRDLASHARWDSCAVVGTSDSLTDSTGLGSTIDEATAVIRVGDAPTKGYEDFVGSRTTLRVQRKENCGFSESPQEMCLVFDSLAVPRGSDGRAKCTSHKSSSCELLVASRRMISYGKAYWRFAGAPMAIGSQAEGSGGLRGTLSAEMYAVALAMHICGKVQVYGLALSPGEDVYWQGGAEVDMGGHAEQMEQRCHQVLRSGLFPRVTVV